MSIPDKIGPINPSGNSLSGIINHLKEQYSINNPREKGIVVPTASSTYQGSIDTVVTHGSSVWITAHDSPPYLQLQFPGRYLFPVGYSLRGVKAGNTWCYSKRWRLEGFNPGEENDTSKWDLLARNSSLEQNFCLNEAECQTLNVSTYNMRPTRKGYQYIRWTGEEMACKEIKFRFSTSGVDVYGTLSTKQRRQNIKTCLRNINTYSNMLLSYTLLICS